MPNEAGWNQILTRWPHAIAFAIDRTGMTAVFSTAPVFHGPSGKWVPTHGGQRHELGLVHISSHFEAERTMEAHPDHAVTVQEQLQAHYQEKPWTKDMYAREQGSVGNQADTAEALGIGVGDRAHLEERGIATKPESMTKPGPQPDDLPAADGSSRSRIEVGANVAAEKVYGKHHPRGEKIVSAAAEHIGVPPDSPYSDGTVEAVPIKGANNPSEHERVTEESVPDIVEFALAIAEQLPKTKKAKIQPMIDAMKEAWNKA